MTQYHLRRKEKAMSEMTVLTEILSEGKFLTLALCRENEPYAVTLNYGYDSNRNVIYLHAANTGRKLDILQVNSRVCATVIVDHGYLDGKCDHAYQSVIMSGNIVIVDDLTEKIHGLNIMVDQLEPDPEPVKKNMVSNRNIQDGVCILRFDIDEISGKQSI